jgi:hypothetical protein
VKLIIKKIYSSLSFSHIHKNYYLLCDLDLTSISLTFASTYFPGKDLADVFKLLAFVADDVTFAVRLFKGVFALEGVEDDDEAPIDTSFFKDGVVARDLEDADGTRGVEVDDDEVFDGVFGTEEEAILVLVAEEVSTIVLPLATNNSDSNSSSVAFVSI